MQALSAIVGSQPRPNCTCSSLASFRTRLRTMIPSVVVTRTRLLDGYSDDVFALLAEKQLLPRTKVVALASADCSSKQEARQLTLGADCVLRDPLRTEVLQQYIAKFLRSSVVSAGYAFEPEVFSLGKATVRPDERVVSYRGRETHLSPKEVELARLLSESKGKILTYDVLYCELFGRTFSGESANMRVLLGKLAGSCRKVGLDLRGLIRVIPKSGYAFLSSEPG